MVLFLEVKLLSVGACWGKSRDGGSLWSDAFRDSCLNLKQHLHVW